MRLKLTFLVIALVLGSLLGSLSMAQDTSEVTILYWQASSILNPYLSSGTKDIDASAIVLEPLANIGPDGQFVPVLARRDSNVGKRRRLRRFDLYHLDAARRCALVGWHALYRCGCHFHLGILHSRRGWLHL